MVVKLSAHERLDEELFVRVLKQSLAPSNEQVFLLGDRGVGVNDASVVLTEGFRKACKSLGIAHQVMYQNTKTRGESADLVVMNALKKLPRKSIIMVNVSNRLGSMKALGHSFRSFAAKREHRFTSASTLGSIAPKHFPSFLGALDVDYAELERRTARVHKKLNDGREVHITTKAGTDVMVDIEGMGARSATGVYREPGRGGNLPGSEAYIAPRSKGVEGVVVIDGSVRLRNHSRLVKGRGVRMDIKHGDVVSISKTAEGKELEQTLRWAHRASEHPWGVRRIGELGIGTNSCAKIIGATILDEKVLGTAHVAIGSNKWFGGGVYSIIHLDQVFKDPVIRVDGRLLKP